MKLTNIIRLPLIAVLLLFLTANSSAEQEYIQAHFKIDVANEMQQLSWISEMAYRLSDYQKKLKSGEIHGTNEVFCDAPLMTTNTFIEYLNKNHTGEEISAKQAIKTVFMELEKAYPCKK